MLCILPRLMFNVRAVDVSTVQTRYDVLVKEHGYAVTALTAPILTCLLMPATCAADVSSRLAA